jgi:hypothetical protein
VSAEEMVPNLLVFARDRGESCQRIDNGWQTIARMRRSRLMFADPLGGAPGATSALKAGSGPRQERTRRPGRSRVERKRGVRERTGKARAYLTRSGSGFVCLLSSRTDGGSERAVAGWF